ncbi:MAG: AAA family ATPase [Peptoniphilaceae bacterium]|nr:AAA family ATPase [Peptoniphilaceae bacterium]
MFKELAAQGVSPALLQKVRDQRAQWGEIACGDSTPRFIYEGCEVWEAAIHAILAGENLLLVGEKATGKNVLAENLADLFGRPRRTVSFHVATDQAALIGTDTLRNGAVEFRPGPIADVAVKGAFGILDEINMARNDAIAVLHATLDFRRVIDLPGYEPIFLHPATRFIATMNHDYLGTRELNEALSSRFVILHMPTIAEGALRHLLRVQFPALSGRALDQLVGLFFDLHRKAEHGEISSKAVDLRGLLAALRLMESGLAPATALDMGMTHKSFDSFEQEIVRDVIRLRFDAREPASALFEARR